MSQCPGKSPKSKSPCTLADNELDHYLGHEGFDRESASGNVVSWGLTRDDYDRWAAYRC